MHIRFDETICGRTPAVVLPVLERCLREIAWDVVQEENRLIAYGIGPSERTVNCSDETIVTVDGRGAATLLRVDAEYQGSSLVDAAWQDNSVQYRLRWAVECLKRDLDVGSGDERDPEVGQAEDSLVTALVAPRVDERGLGLAERMFVPSEYEARPFFACDDELERVPAVNEPQAFWVAARTKVVASVATSRWRLLRVPMAVAALLAAMAAGFGWWSWHERSDRFAAAAAVRGVEVATEGSTGDEAARAQDGAVQERWLKQWVSDWAATMRSRDAAAQAAFYADVVDPYGDLGMARFDTVLRDRMAAIQARKGLWTFKVENVKVTSESENAAQVALVKHFMTQSDSLKVVERFVLCRLDLRRVNGEWKITGEQDLK